jgi:hypothetical protein
MSIVKWCFRFFKLQLASAFQSSPQDVCIAKQLWPFFAWDASALGSLSRAEQIPDKKSPFL